MKKRTISLISVVLLVVALCCGVASAVEPKASLTLNYYNVIIGAGDNPGEIVISYDVQATDVADLVGVANIKIYRANGSYVTTISGSTRNGLLVKDSNRHVGDYIYKGTSGDSYYAEVTVCAEIGDNYDSRTVTTDTVQTP